MIKIFYIKKKVKQLNQDNTILLKKYNNISNYNNEEIFKEFKTNLNGLSKEEANSRLEEKGQNIVVKDNKRSWLYFFALSFKDQFIIVLFILSIINFFLGDKFGSLIIISIGFLSALIRFFQDYSVYKFNEKLKSRITSTTILMRNGKEQEERVEDVVIGDVVKLNAGSIIPADVCIIQSKDLFINQSVFTGESVPVEKSTENLPAKEVFNLNNICLMGCSVVSGNATAIAISTGFDTYLGHMGKELDNEKELTNFDIGMKKITNLLVAYMVLVCIVVLVIQGVFKHNYLDAFLFALSAAVGITPTMLPMIVNVNLTRGTKVLAKKKTLVKKMDSIQNLGAIDVLCTDKTGTLTENKIVLQKYIDVDGDENIDILEYAYLNSYYSTGIKNLVDRAIISYGNEHNIKETISNYEKIDEIPFDYTRKKVSVVVKDGSNYRMLTKGALEEVLKICINVKNDNKIYPIDKKLIYEINDSAKKLASEGMQVIALAEKNEYPGIKVFDSTYEKDMTFVGFVAFLDQPKKDAKKIINSLREIGVQTKILTGDNPYATNNICSLAGLNSDNIVIGADIDNLTDEQLSILIEKVDVFARLDPIQKERVVRAYRKNGHVVGYMGDGVNDAPSLHAADVGISVNSATDIAKEASDIILLERNLGVLYDGVIIGRKIYGNIIKYMKMALSADFGDVFSIMIASIFLPFLPLLPIQMLLQDFIYDFSQIGIPYDDVDDEFLRKPKKWNTKGISHFMNVMGITSSVVDVISFLIFWFILGYNSVDKQAYFQTAWFVTCLTTELIIIHNVRTAKIPFIESRASKPLMVLSLISIILTIMAPLFLSKIGLFDFVTLPLSFYGYLLSLVALYMFIVAIIKKIYIKKYKEWL